MIARKFASEFWNPNPLNNQRMYGFVIVTSAADTQSTNPQTSAETIMFFIRTFLLFVA